MSFQNAKVKTVGANPDEYLVAKAERGTPKFIVSSSSLREFARCPSRWRAGYVSPASKAKEWGSLFDCFVLTPDQFPKRYAVVPEDAPRRPSKAQLEAKKNSPASLESINFWAKFRADHPGCQEVSQQDMLDVATARKRLLEWDDGLIANYLEASDRQVWITAEWKDEDTGLVIPCQCLIDLVPRADTEFCKTAGDLKTATSAHPSIFDDAAFRYGYHWQAAFDLDMLRAATGEDRMTWCFAIVENFAPWEPNWAMYGQSQEMGQPGFLELGREEQFFGYKLALANYAKCLKSGQWPSYNRTDESVQGCCVLRPKPFMAQRLMFAPQYEFAAEEEAPAAEESAPERDDIIP